MASLPRLHREADADHANVIANGLTGALAADAPPAERLLALVIAMAQEARRQKWPLADLLASVRRCMAAPLYRFPRDPQ